jgi:hypothetical protein
MKFTQPLGQEEVFLEKRLTGGGLNWRMLHSRDGRIRFEAPAQPNPVVLSTASVPSDVWQHLTLLNTGTRIRLYLNGVRQSERDHRLVADAEGTVRLGGAASGGYFAGLIDEITIHTGEFTDEQIYKQHRAFVSACVSAP